MLKGESMIRTEENMMLHFNTTLTKMSYQLSAFGGQSVLLGCQNQSGGHRV